MVYLIFFQSGYFHYAWDPLRLWYRFVFCLSRVYSTAVAARALVCLVKVSPYFSFTKFLGINNIKFASHFCQLPLAFASRPCRNILIEAFAFTTRRAITGKFPSTAVRVIMLQNTHPPPAWLEIALVPPTKLLKQLMFYTSPPLLCVLQRNPPSPAFVARNGIDSTN